MKKKAVLAALFSAVVPGLGQWYAGKGERGAAILIATIIVGNLNAIWLTLYAQPVTGVDAFWAVGLPRVLHDLFAVYGIVFLIWQIWDAAQLARHYEAPAPLYEGQTA
ncbi:MAG TPA: hypothetical protein VLA32_03940 [Anaerolineales bacterium]|jgi:TM2 domain-containing membrane protein YozV|nr:hypothetical protein [Anaerolineales bacterium]